MLHAASVIAAVAVIAGGVPPPDIVSKPIPYGAERKSEMAAYAKRHYNISSWRLHPRVIVQHYTASESFSSAYNTFAANAPDSELHELPGVCTHFIIDKDGTIYQLVPTGVMCRHTVGLNAVAVGIEHVGTSDRQILGNSRQISASLRLTLWLMQRHRIDLRDVIGHNESRSSPYHYELYRSWRCQTHGDWVHADMEVYRARLTSLARRYRVRTGPPAYSPRPAGC